MNVEVNSDLKVSRNSDMSLPRTNIIAFRLALFAAVIAFTHLATTPLNYPAVVNINDKAGHMLTFYVLALLQDFSFPDKRFDFYKALPLLGYGILIEIIQYFLADRTFSLLDLASGVVGLTVYRFSLPGLKYVPLLRRRWNADM